MSTGPLDALLFAALVTACVCVAGGLVYAVGMLGFALLRGFA